ncbi:MAG TPA: hypothetical protein VN114_00895 [Oxalicibacterium sp.]|uniref:hypothetical protein n=1 Tax=Oxalicibacterium sp. TaxID=2766525 RepID=UPI002C8B9B9F|nr:hypothetical protein [Oxalicibacterium sp.]HWU97043.1 hypothetical protein [Oxalicibacterium sp.]
MSFSACFKLIFGMPTHDLGGSFSREIKCFASSSFAGRLAIVYSKICFPISFGHASQHRADEEYSVPPMV